MNTKIGVINENKTLANEPKVWKGNWADIEKDGVRYLVINSFEKYFTQDIINQLDYVFSQTEYNNWVTKPKIVPQVVIEYTLADGRVARWENIYLSTNILENKLDILVGLHTYDSEGIEQKDLYEQEIITVEPFESISAQPITVVVYNAIQKYYKL